MKENVKEFGVKEAVALGLAGVSVVGVPVSANAVCSDAEPQIVMDQEDAIRYIVKEGDTLGKISKLFFGVEKYWEEIAKFNHLDDPNELHVGQVIYIPRDLLYNYKEEVVNKDCICKEEVVNKHCNCEFTEDVSEYDCFDQVYTIKAGDTMNCIVRTFYGFTSRELVDKLTTLQGWKNPHQINEGDTMIIPCLEKLMKVKQRDYSAQYEAMERSLQQQKSCEPRPFIPCGQPTPFIPCETVHPCNDPLNPLMMNPYAYIEPVFIPYEVTGYYCYPVTIPVYTEIGYCPSLRR